MSMIHLVLKRLATDPGLFVEHASAYLRQQWTVDVQHLRAGGKYS